MTLRYAVGIKIGNRADQMTVEAEDALIAALKVKTAHPEAAITYVRKRNARGDRRHPHSTQIGPGVSSLSEQGCVSEIVSDEGRAPLESRFRSRR